MWLPYIYQGHLLTYKMLFLKTCIRMQIFPTNCYGHYQFLYLSPLFCALFSSSIAALFQVFCKIFINFFICGIRLSLIILSVILLKEHCHSFQDLFLILLILNLQTHSLFFTINNALVNFLSFISVSSRFSFFFYLFLAFLLCVLLFNSLLGFDSFCLNSYISA